MEGRHQGRHPLKAHDLSLNPSHERVPDQARHEPRPACAGASCAPNQATKITTDRVRTGRGRPPVRRGERGRAAHHCGRGAATWTGAMTATMRAPLAASTAATRCRSRWQPTPLWPPSATPTRRCARPSAPAPSPSRAPKSSVRPLFSNLSTALMGLLMPLVP